MPNPDVAQLSGMEFVVSPKDADRVREMLEKQISGPHLGIDGSYEDGVIDTIRWILGQSPFIAHKRDWTKKQKGKA